MRSNRRLLFTQHTKRERMYACVCVCHEGICTTPPPFVYVIQSSRVIFYLFVVSALLLLFARESLCVHTRNTHRVTVNPLPFEYALPTIKTVSALNSEPAGLKDLPVLMFLLPPWLSLSLFLVPCVCDSVRLVSSRLVLFLCC